MVGHSGFCCLVNDGGVALWPAVGKYEENN